MTVLRPSLPPAICTTIKTRSLAVCATRESCIACGLADATPRLKIAGMTIPADTTSNPSLIIALRLSFIIFTPLRPIKTSVEMVFRRCHHQEQGATHAIEWIALSIGQGYLASSAVTVRGGKVVEQLGSPVAFDIAIEQKG